MKILGIDPGTLHLGWGIIETNSSGAVVRVDHGCLSAPAKMNFIERIGVLGELVQELISREQPDTAVIEKIFLGKNVDSAFKLGHIRGVCAVECQKQRAKIVEYSPRTVKKQITGSGSAEKALVRNFLYRQLGIKEDPKKTLDASDALALAFCHIMQDSVTLKVRGMEKR